MAKSPKLGDFEEAAIQENWMEIW